MFLVRRIAVVAIVVTTQVYQMICFSFQEINKQQHPYLRKVCLKGDPEIYFETDQLIEHLGYPVEIHKVTTEDGYILKVYRIPRGKSARGRDTSQSKPPVLLQHGLLSSSDDWVVNFENQSLGYMLADAGYDVWLANVRGNRYGLEHTVPVPSKHEFFQFSWDEMAAYDLPATIDYILNVTGYEDLHLIGHSMGTTMAFALLSTKLEYNSKIRHFHALGPVVTLNYAKTPIRYLAPLAKDIKKLLDLLGYEEFLPNNALLKILAQSCASVAKVFCKEIIFLFTGYDPQQLNSTRIPIYVSHNPAGTSSRTIVHFAQEINSGFFQHYDYGKAENMRKYGQCTPPKYDVGNVTAPVTLYWAANDLLASPKDVDDLYHSLRNCDEKHKVGGANYAHLDFLWAVDNAALLNNYLIAKLNNETQSGARGARTQ